MSDTLSPLRVASKTAFVTVKSAIETPNSSNTVLLFLNLNMQYWCIDGKYKMYVALHRNGGGEGGDELLQP